MNICLFTNSIYDELPAYVLVSDQQKRKYAELHGIDFVSTRLNPRPDSHPVWCKPMLCAWMLQQYDWVVWMDADAMPVNMDFDLAGYLGAVNEPVVMGKDINGYNAGVFAVNWKTREWLLDMDCRRSQYTRRFREQQCMSDSFDRGEMQCHVPSLEIGWNDFLPSLYKRRPDQIDRNVYRKGVSWVLHLPALDNIRRLGILSREAQQ